jgi:hypothetical protein
MDKKEPELTDIGTRYQHMKDYAEALAACADIIERRGLKSKEDAVKFAKFTVAAELAQHTVDNFAGYNKLEVEKYLLHTLSEVPKTGDLVVGGRGTELAHEYQPWEHKDTTD